jgi:hypothetical protein
VWPSPLSVTAPGSGMSGRSPPMLEVMYLQ